MQALLVTIGQAHYEFKFVVLVMIMYHMPLVINAQILLHKIISRSYVLEPCRQNRGLPSDRDKSLCIRQEQELKAIVYS